MPAKPIPTPFRKIVVKATGLYFGGLGGAALLAEWSTLVDQLKSAVMAETGAIFYAYFAWVVAHCALEAVRRRLRYDLEQSRIENRKARKNRRNRT